MNKHRLIEISGVVLGWTTLGLQFYLMQENRVTDSLETTIRFFSFFTILSNLLVTLCFTSLFFNILPFFRKFKTLTAVAVYISIVAIVYNTVLRILWKPTGVQQLVDELLHAIIPILYVYYWFIIEASEKLQLKSLTNILLFPFVYLIYVLIRGSFSEFYPYPFIDVPAIGFIQVLINSVLIMIVFVVVSVLFIRSSRS